MGRDCSLLRGRGVAGFPLAALFCTAKRTGGIRIEASGNREVEGLLICLRTPKEPLRLRLRRPKYYPFFDAGHGFG